MRWPRPREGPSGQALQSETDDTIIDMDAGIERRIGVGNKADSDGARLTIEELCERHDVPPNVVIPPTADLVAADRRGEPLDRAIAPDVWDAVEKLVDSLGLEGVRIG